MADGTTLPVHRRRTLFDICSCHCLHCQALSDDKLGIGCLAHEGAIFLKLSQEGIEMERELFMGSCLYFVFIYFEFVPLYLGAGVPQSLALPLNEPELESRWLLWVTGCSSKQGHSANIASARQVTRKRVMHSVIQGVVSFHFGTHIYDKRCCAI